MESRTIRWGGFIGAILALVSLSGFANAAARNGRTPNGTDETQTNSRKDQLRLSAQATHLEVKTLLTEMLGAAQKNQTPSEQLVMRAQACLEKNKQNALAYDEQQRADYMLLESWTGYAKGNLPEALSWSMRACKQDEASQDAWISQAVFSMISGKRPLEPRIEKPKPETEPQRYRPERVRQPRRNAETAPAVYKPEPYSTKGVFEFDLPALRSEFFRENFERLECKTAEGQSFEYVPGRDTMCVLFWQSVQSAAVSTPDPNSVAAPTAELNMQMDYGQMDYGTGVGATIDEQRQYFVRLMNACKDTATIKFVQIDTLRPKDLTGLDMSIYRDSAIPTLIAAHPDCNAKRFACDASTPFMMIVDKNGSVKYAGPADSFVPAFILTATTGKAVPLQDQSGGDLGGGHLMESPFGELGERPISSGRVDPNAPVATPPAAKDPNAPAQPAAAPASQRVPQTEYGFMTDDAEQQVKAENLLRIAELHIKESVKIRGKNPGEGIKAAREVIATYPNTPYAERAKKYLREVPDRYKEQYNITDEELM